MRRRLAAVLIADVAGYTRLMDAAEAETHTRLMALFDEIVRPDIATHHGRMVKSTGDGFLATFGSVNNAVQCAVRIQQAAQKREAAEPPESAFRMGLHVGDVSQHRGDVYGAGIARRELTLEAAIAKLDKFHLLILDDLAYVTKDQAETSVLFELISAR